MQYLGAWDSSTTYQSSSYNTGSLISACSHTLPQCHWSFPRYSECVKKKINIMTTTTMAMVAMAWVAQMTLQSESIWSYTWPWHSTLTTIMPCVESMRLGTLIPSGVSIADSSSPPSSTGSDWSMISGRMVQASRQKWKMTLTWMISDCQMPRHTQKGKETR